MCEYKVFLVSENGEQLIMDNVETVEPEDGGLRVVNLFGEEKHLAAHIHALELVDGRILLKA